MKPEEHDGHDAGSPGYHFIAFIVIIALAVGAFSRNMSTARGCIAAEASTRNGKDYQHSCPTCPRRLRA